MNIQTNIKFIQSKFITTYPWIKSREGLILRILIDSIIILLISKNNNLIKFNFYNLCITFIFLKIWITFSYICGRYENHLKRKKNHLFNELWMIIVPLLMVFIYNQFVVNFLNNFKNSIIEASGLFFITLLSFTFQRILNYKIFKGKFKNETWYIINDAKKSELLTSFLKYSRIKVEVKSIDLNQLKKLNLQTTDGIIIDDINEILKFESELLYNLRLNNVKIISSLEWAGFTLQRYPTELLSESDSNIEKIFLKVKRNKFEIRLKRITEFFISLILLLFCIPILIICGLLIKLEDGGPIFYSQIRTGFKGELFKLYKMRTMRIDAEKNGPAWSSKNDHRITKIGNFLRKSRIDELPQLLLVINGKLSLIGPRPERPDFDNVLKKNIPHYDLRYLMKPGLSGWAQVNYPYGASEKDARNKLSFDLFYINNFSTPIDLLILFKTIKLVFNRKGAIAQN